MKILIYTIELHTSHDHLDWSKLRDGKIIKVLDVEKSQREIYKFNPLICMDRKKKNGNRHLITSYFMGGHMTYLLINLA